MNKIVKYGGIYALAFTLSTTTAFFLQYQGGKSPSSTVDNNSLTPGEKLVASILNYEGMNISAKVEMNSQENYAVKVDISGQAKIASIKDIRINGDVSLSLNGNKIKAELAYYDETLAFSFNDNYYKLKTDDLLAFIDMVPTYGINIELPSEISNIDFDAIQEEIAAIAEEDKKSSQDGYYYVINIGTDTNVFNLYIKTDADDNFLGIRTDTIFYNDMKFSLDATIDPVKNEELTLVNPLSGTDAEKYEDFSPIFNLFDYVYNFLKKDSATVKVNATINNTNKDESVSSYEANLALGYCLSTKTYTLGATLEQNSHANTFNFVYENEAVYASFHSLKVSIATETISNLIQYAMSQINDEKITAVVDTLTTSMKDVKLSDIADKISSFIGHMSVGEESLTIALKPSAFNLDMQDIQVVVSWDTNGLSSITLSNIAYSTFDADVTITFGDYVAPSYVASEYVAIEPATGLVDSILTLLKQKQFRIEFDALVDKTDETVKDITIDGGLQFDIENMFGYGEVDIVDGDGYTHNIKADMRSKEEIIFAYNKTLKGKFSSQTMKEMGQLVSTAMKDPDDHMTEILGDILNQTVESPLSQIIAGDYGLALSYDIISNLQITDSYLSCSVNLNILGMDKNVDLRVDYATDYDNSVGILKGLSITNLVLDDAVISLNLNLKDFNSSLDSTRLDPYDEYLDFSDIEVLLELGINTSKFNYYHFTTTVTMALNGLLGTELLSLDLPLDIKIRNDKGQVKVAVEFTNIPVKSLLNPNDTYYSAKDRTASIYYADNTIYVKRTEQVKIKAILGIAYGDYHTYTLTRTCDIDYFKDNILTILMSDVLSLSDTILNMVEKSTSSSETSQIEYEKLLNDFVYNKASNYFYFDINLAELANDESFSSFTVKIYEDPEKALLTGLDVHLTISVGLTINIDMSLDFKDDSAIEVYTYDEAGQITGNATGTTLDALEAYVSAHQSDTRNEKNASVN